MEITATRPIDTLSHAELCSIIEQPISLCISLFLPIQRGELAQQQNPTRLENMLRRAEVELHERGLTQATRQELLAPAWQLIEDWSFWAHQSTGLAIFVAPELFRVYRLPLPFAELMIIDEHIYISPLLPLLSGDGQFYVLALSLGGAQLFTCTRSSISPVALQDVPANLEDALKYDEFARQSQFHPGAPGRGGERGAIFYGQGARDGRAAKEEILRYFQQIDRGVRAALCDEHAPLVLAGIDYLLPIYHTASSYAHLHEAGIPCNPDDLDREELHRRGWALIAPHFDQAQVAASERYQQLRATRSSLASNYLRTIIPAAYEGRIDTLFVARGQQRWGAFDPFHGGLTLHEDATPCDSELLNLAAIQTIRLGGTVYVVAADQLPEAAPLAAILRY